MNFDFLKKKWFKIPYTVLLYGFAAYGFFLTATFFAMKFKLTNEGGQIDENNRYFQSIADKYNQGFVIDSANVQKYHQLMMVRIGLLSEYFPTNAEYILKSYEQTKSEKLALQMLDVADLRLSGNHAYKKARHELNKRLKHSTNLTGLSLYEWMNVREWKFFREALEKDKKWIDSAAHVSGVEARTIVACLVGEQVRLFNSRRERFKNYVAPLKTLALETNLSYGVTGIKESTAMKIENNLRNSSSPFYLGKKYEHLLDYDTTRDYSNNLNDTLHVRLQRLIQYSNHYYSYLYAGLFVKQIASQWRNAGFPIDNRPEILATIFNLGYQKSVPNANPQVGGSNFKINDIEYTFGGVAYDFYYSGEMLNIFPYEKNKFY